MNDQDLPEEGVIPMVTAAGTTPNDTASATSDAELQDNQMRDDDSVEDNFADEEDGDLFDEDQSGMTLKQQMKEIFALDPLPEIVSELDVLTLVEAALYLKVENSDVRRLIKEQDLPGRKIGDEWRFLRGALADWLRAPGGMPAKTASAAPVARAERPARPERPAFDDRPPRAERPRRRFPEGEFSAEEGDQSQSRPPRPRPQFRSQNQFGGAADAGGQQGSYPPPRRGRYENDQQQQQPPQGEYRPPRKRPPFRDNQGGGQAGGNQFGGTQAGGNQAGGNQFGGAQGGGGYVGGPSKPKREALGNQRFKRLDRRRFGNEQAGNEE